MLTVVPSMVRENRACARGALPASSLASPFSACRAPAPCSRHSALAQGKLDVIRHDATTPEVDTDIDKRCRTVLEEIDLSFECTAPYMRSSVMHSVPQMFPIDVLRADLERELDRLLCEQVFERERATRIMVRSTFLFVDLFCRPLVIDGGFLLEIFSSYHATS